MFPSLAPVLRTEAGPLTGTVLITDELSAGSCIASACFLLHLLLPVSFLNGISTALWQTSESSGLP
jgi:hypothetical protein